MPTSDPYRWREWTAGLAAGMLLLPFVWPAPTLRAAVMFLTAIALAGCVVALWKAFGPRSRYDLHALKEVDERERLRVIDVESEASDADQVLCLGCGNVFESSLPVCPHCRRPTG